MSKLTTFITISLILILSGCGGSEPTFDGSSEEATTASLEAMFPGMDFSDGPGAAPGGAEDIPPALEAYACGMMKVAFSNFGMPEDELAKLVGEEFDGMTAADMEAYGVENDLIGCLEAFKDF